MQSKTMGWVALCLLAILGAGCSPQPESTAPETQGAMPAPSAETTAQLQPATAEAQDSAGSHQAMPKIDPAILLKSWNEFIAMPRENMSNPRGQSIIAQLVMTNGQEGIRPIVESIADPAQPADAKVLTTLSLAPYIDQTYTTYLTPLTNPGGDATTRSCALHLLAVAADVQNEPLFRSLLKDPENRVRMAAKLGLLRLNAPDAHAMMLEDYRKEEATREERENILHFLLPVASAQDVPMFNLALRDEELSPKIREGVLTALAQHGDGSSLEPLEAVAASSAGEEVKTLANSALTAIKERLQAQDAAGGPQEDAAAGSTGTAQ